MTLYEFMIFNHIYSIYDIECGEHLHTFKHEPFTEVPYKYKKYNVVGWSYEFSNKFVPVFRVRCKYGK